MLVLTLAVSTSRLVAVERGGSGSATPQPSRRLPRLLLAGGGRWAPQAEPPAQQPQLQLRPPVQQLWNVTLLLEVSGSGLQPGQLAGRLRQPFLQALMPAAAAAAGGLGRQSQCSLAERVLDAVLLHSSASHAYLANLPSAVAPIICCPTH